MATFTNPQDAVRWLRALGAKSLHSDSRQVNAGDAFVAWPGGLRDPRHHVEGALKNAAVACLVEHSGADAFSCNSNEVSRYAGLKMDAGIIASEFFDHPSKAMAVLAITGTNGKTSTAWWLAQALTAMPGASAMACGLVGTLGVGQVPAVGEASELQGMDLVATGFTTPDPIVLQRTLRQFVDAGLTACAMEASSIGIVEHRLNGTHIRAAIFTNFTQDHLDYHGDMQSYWDAKRQLFSWPDLAHAIINIDDPQGAALASTLADTGMDVWTTSLQENARIRAQNIRYSTQGLCFDVCEGDQRYSVGTRMIGAYNVSNLLGVIATLRALGGTLRDITAVCGLLAPVPGRMECLSVPGAPLVAVDYAHTPDAIGKALDALRPLAAQRGGKLWCVFGCGGDRDNAKRPMMGALAGQKADTVVVTSDNPRNEKPEAIIAQILLGIGNAANVQVQADRGAAIAQAIQQAHAADVILLAGKGHETTQECAGVKLEFSDTSHAMAALRHRVAASGGKSA